ncbi:Putative cold shock protein [Kitasatospora sp. MMS16-BH015]|uniref:cold-shock protein n=1 Tax=Kitasatospora sp. MMS16-BH015 TaxID=2018025 RepID=UPI000CA3BDD8|nr:cold shock domain-containing protein [Kitasatospora sp. MMS16-BH015]AUG81006.1 Putative cold shock protein [Kitasatospora sp. MMS16-BH015]
MATGVVKSYNVHHGYGVITPDDGGPEVKVYFDSIQGEGARELAEGQKVEYDLTEQEGRAVAEHVRAL